MKTTLATGTPTPTTFDADAFERFLAARTEPAWVTERRREAFAEYLTHLAKPDPTEEYRRVELRFLKPERFSVAEAGADPATFARGHAGRRVPEGPPSTPTGPRPASNWTPNCGTRGSCSAAWRTS